MIKLCECGCNKPTKICQHTSAKYEVVKGKPNRYLRGHALRKHGHTVRINKNGKRVVSSEYMAYNNAKSRCQNPGRQNYYNYGGRGIKFLFNSFEEFINHIGRKPSPQHSLDRYPDKNGNYEIGNVRWATLRQQTKNKRRPTFRIGIWQFSDREIYKEFYRRKLSIRCFVVHKKP